MNLRRFPRTMLVAGFVLGCVCILCAAEKATLRSNSPMYSDASSRSPVLATLKKNQAVSLELRLSSPEGPWCRVRAGASTGYVKCGQLLVRRVGSSRNVLPRPQARSLYTEICGNGNGDTWRERYNLTGDQLAAAEKLAERIGVLQCGPKAARFQQAFHAVGMTAQSMDALKAEWWERERTDHCNDHLELFLQELQNYVGPEQKTLLENDRKDVHRLASTGQVPLFCAY